MRASLRNNNLSYMVDETMPVVGGHNFVHEEVSRLQLSQVGDT